jgi:hypothetical protein
MTGQDYSDAANRAGIAHAIHLLRQVLSSLERHDAHGKIVTGEIQARAALTAERNRQEIEKAESGDTGE